MEPRSRRAKTPRPQASRTVMTCRWESHWTRTVCLLDVGLSKFFTSVAVDPMLASDVYRPCTTQGVLPSIANLTKPSSLRAG